jgi:hypothetical protein
MPYEFKVLKLLNTALGNFRIGRESSAVFLTRTRLGKPVQYIMRNIKDCLSGV